MRPNHDATTSVLLGVITAAVATKATQPLDDTIRRRHPHPRRGVARVVAIGIKEVVRPEAQIATGLADDRWPSDVVAGALLGGAVAHAMLAS